MGRYSEEDVAAVRDSTDIVALVSESVLLKQKGRLYWGNCPFHQEKTPSFKIDPATGLWHCFGCGAGGDVFGFVMRRENLEFPDALRLLSERGRITITERTGALPSGHRERLMAATEAAASFYHQALITSVQPKADAARKYLSRRGFHIATAKRFSLGWAEGGIALWRHLQALGFSAEEAVAANLAINPDSGRLKDRFFDRIMFPIYSLTGRPVAFGGRVLDDIEPKYLNTGETPIFSKSRLLYGIDKAKNEIVKTGSAIVVEGYTDVIAMHEAGVRNAVATLGTSLTRHHVKLLARFARQIVYLFDSDDAGIRAAERAFEFIDVALRPEAGGTPIDLRVAIIPAGQDPADYLSTAGGRGMGELISQSIPLIQFVIDRKLAAHDTSVPEGRSAALAQCAAVLAAVKGTLLAQDYTNYVADRLRTDFKIVENAVRQAKPAFAQQGFDTKPASPVPQQRQPVSVRAQHEFVGLLAAYPELRAKAQGLLYHDLLDDPMALRLMEIILSSDDSVGKELYSRVASVDKEAAEALAGLIIAAAQVEEADFIARQLLRKLKEFALERQIIAKKAQLHEVDPTVDRAKYDELFLEITSLQKYYYSLRSDGTDRENKEEWEQGDRFSQETNE